MNINKFISYLLLCNKGIIVNLHKLHFSSFHFSLQPNKRVFHPPTFLSLQRNTKEGKLNIFHILTFPSSYNFPSSHFYTPLSKQSLNDEESATAPSHHQHSVPIIPPQNHASSRHNQISEWTLPFFFSKNKKHVL